MPAKLKPEFVYAALKSKGISHLSPYLYATEKMDLECDACGHNWKSTYDNIKQGRSCPSCSRKLAVAKMAASKRLPLAEINKRLQPYEVTVGMGYQNTKVNTTFSCLRCGHEWDDIVNLMFQRDAKTYLCPTERLQKRGSDVKKKSRKSSRKTQLRRNPRIMVAVPSEFEGQFATYEECVDFLIQDLRSRLEQNGGTGYYDLGHVSITTTLFSYSCPKGHSDKRSLMDAYALNHLCTKCGAEFETSPRAKKKRWPSRKPFFSDLTASEDYLALLEESNIKFLGIEQTESGQTLAKTICRTCRQLYKKSIKRLNKREISPLCSCSDPQMNESFGSRLLAKVKDRGGNLLTEVVKGAHDKYLIQCAEEHDPRPVQGGSVVYANSWCLECAGQLPRTLSELSEIASKRGGKLLSTEYTNVDDSYDFECSLGHEFSNSFKHVESGQWCPTCNKSTKSEEIARETFKQIFGVKFKKVRPKWLKNTRGYQMEIDGYSKEIGVGFEYQGIQHFEHFGLYDNDLQRRKLDDRTKAELCAENGVKLVILTYQQEYEDFSESIRDQLITFGLDVSEYDFDSPIDLDKAYIRDDRLLELKALLKPKGIEVLSTKWISVNVKYDLRCLNCGHRWKARGSSFFNSRRVSGCDKCARAKAGERNKLGLEPLQKYADKYGGELVSTAYVRRSHYYEWKCAQGHSFSGNFNNMEFRGQFCPECEDRQTRKTMTEKQARTYLESRNLSLAGPYVSKTKDVLVACNVCKVEWTKSVKHIMEASMDCQNCANLEYSANAANVMRQAGVEPLVPYPGAISHWLCKCMTCGNEITPSYGNVSRGQGACSFCQSGPWK